MVAEQADRSIKPALGVEELISLFEIAKGIAREPSLAGLIDCILADSRPWLGADACSLFLLDPDTRELVVHSAQGGSLISRGQIRVPMGAGIVGAAMEKRETIKVDDVRLDPRFFAEADRETGYTTYSLIAVPLLDGDVCRGVIEFINPVGRDCFSMADVALAEYFSGLVASTLCRMELAEIAVANALQQRDLEIALEVQRGLLPKAFLPGDRFGGMDLCGVCDPALQVGGDLYDFFSGPDGQLFFLVGDVSGKGVGAGMFMAQTRTLIRAVARAGGSPAEILQEVNDLLYPDNDALLFVTILFGSYDPDTGGVEYAQAGHNKVIQCSRLGGPAYGPYGGVPLGPFPLLRSETVFTHLDPGDCLILYTDGVTEAMDAQCRCYGEERLLSLVQAHSQHTAVQLVDALRQDVAAFVGSAEQSDDITILVLRRMMPAESAAAV